VLGDNRVFRMGESAHIKLHAGTTLLIYGRGFVPLTMGYWLSDSLFSHFDPLLAIYTIWYFVKGKTTKHTPSITQGHVVAPVSILSVCGGLFSQSSRC